MTRREAWSLPADVNAPTLGVCVPVPNDPNHRRAFLGALYELAYADNWQWDGQLTGRDASLVWKEIFFEVAAKIGIEVCEDGFINCREYPNTAPFIDYFPNDPRYTPDLVPPGYILPPWYFSTPASELAYGTQPGDIVTTLERLPPGSLPTILPSSGLPRCRVNVNVIDGATVRVHMRNMIAGSLMQITVDDSVPSLQFYDLTKDLISIPPETGDLVIFEHIFETGGQHHIDFIVVPKVNDEIPFIYFGGGVVKVEICGEVVHVPAYTMTCNSGVVELLADGVPVSTIDLAACGVVGPTGPQGPEGPQGPAGPEADYTLARNNGDLQLLKDLVLHSSVPFPNYNTSYNETLHLLELFRDSLIVDTTPLPSYTLLKPSDNVIQLKRNALNESTVEDKFLTYRLQENGDQHELTEDTIVVSSVTDDAGGGGSVETYHEVYWNPKAAEPTPDWLRVRGQWFATTGYIQEVYLGQSRITLQRNLTDGAEIFQWRFEIEIINLSGGLVTMSIVDMNAPADEYNLFTTGEGTQDFVLDLERRYWGGNIQLQIRTDPGETAGITLSDMWERGLGMPARSKMKQSAAFTVFTDVPTNWTIPDV